MALMKIPFNIPYISDNTHNYVQKALESKKHCGDHYFGKKCVDLMKTKYGFHEVFLTTSCTHSLEMAALLLDIQPGDEVITAVNTFVATAGAIATAGGKNPDGIAQALNEVKTYLG